MIYGHIWVGFLMSFLGACFEPRNGGAAFPFNPGSWEEDRLLVSAAWSVMVGFHFCQI